MIESPRQRRLVYVALPRGEPVVSGRKWTLISYGYGTDTTWTPKQSLTDELRALSLVFSSRDITRILGQGAARSTLRQDQIGTLEAGKQADLVLVDGNPLVDVNDLLKVVLTVKGGRIVSDTRGKR